MMTNSEKQQFLEKYKIAMRQLEYKELLLASNKIPKISKDAEVINAFATLLDHQAVLESNWVKKKYLEWQAMRLYKQNLKNDKNNIEAISGIGRIYWHKSNPKAIYYYKQAMKLDPTNPVRMGNLANVFSRLNQLDQAEKLYRQAIATNKAPFGIYLNFLRNIEINKQEAEKIIKETDIKINELEKSESKILAYQQLEEIKNRITHAD
jgi:tetratricopeptide (TPR) repeat protein